MAVFTNPGWLQNAGAVHTAQQMRTYLGALLAGTAGSATASKSRGGVHPAIGTQLQVTQTGSPSMGVQVAIGAAWIPGTELGGQGSYGVFNDAAVTLTITAAHASLPRIDIVQIRVRDSFYSGVSNDAVLDVKAGTPAGSPVAPTQDPNALVLAEVLVGAGVTSIVNANITDKRFYLAGAGGVIPYTLDAAPPSVANDISDGQLLYALDTDRLKITDGTSIFTLWDKNIDGSNIGKEQFAYKTSLETVNNSSAFQNDDALFLPVAANAKYVFELHIGYNTNSTANFKSQFTVPAGASMPMSSFLVFSGTYGITNANGNVTGINGNGTDRPYLCKGTLLTGGSSGTLQFQWAQNAANASNTNVLAGSYLTLLRIA